MGCCFNKESDVLSTYDPNDEIHIPSIHIPPNALSFSMKPLETMPMSDSSIMRNFKKMMRPKYYFQRLREKDFY